LLPSSFFTAEITSTTPGVVKVTSMMSMPPSQSARATLTNCSLDEARMIATRPRSRTRCRLS